MNNLIQHHLKDHIENIALPEGRRPGTAGHDKVEAYLCRQMEALGLVPFRQPEFRQVYTNSNTRFCNIAGYIPGSGFPELLPPLLFGAHYDSVIAGECADDNAAAVAILLELAARFKNRQQERDIVFVFYDAEEPPFFLGPYMGSNVYYREVLQDNPPALSVILDLVGHPPAIPGFEDLLVITGAESAPALPDLLATIPEPGLRPLYLDTRHVGDMSDYASFRNAGDPFLFLTGGHWEHYHRESDTREKLDYTRMAGIVEYLESLINAYPAEDDSDESRGGDRSLPLQIESANRVFAPLLEQQPLPTGSSVITNRDDLDSVVRMLTKNYGL